MMESFTPLTRRAIALGLLILCIFLALSWIVVPLIAADRAALDDLADVRRTLARLEAQAQGPDAPVIATFPAQAAIWATGHRAASETLGGRIAALAANSHVELQLLPRPQIEIAAPDVLSMGLSATGTREDIVRFINVLETGLPQIRFRRFHIARLDQGPPANAPVPATPGTPAAPTGTERPLRLDGEVVVLWGGAR